MFFKKSARKKEKSDIKTVVTIDPYTEKYYEYSNGGFFAPLQKLGFKKSNFNISYVSNRETITSTIYLSRSIPEEDIASVLEIKAYEELGLDQAKDYLIGYYEAKESAESERQFHIFIVDPERLHALFDPINSQTKFIDLIVPAPLLIKKVYDREILHGSGVDGFIYFTQEDAFVALYRNGEYLYSKSIDFSLEQMYDRYCESVGEKVNEEVFFTTLQNEGLKATDPVFREHMSKIFGELFIAINDIVIYAKRAYNLDRIDRLYIGSSLDPIIGLNEYSHSYLGLQSSEFNFDYNIESNEWYIDQLHYLMLLYALDTIAGEETPVDLSVFKRPPPFVYRPGGQFIMALFLSTSLALVYPVFYLVGTYFNETKIYILNKKQNDLSQQVRKYKRILSEKKRKIDDLDKRIDLLSKAYDAKSKTLISIYNKKINYKLKSGIYHSIVGELNKFGVHTDKIKTVGDTLYVSLIGENEGEITELVKKISETFFDRIKSIDIQKIERNKDSNLYYGILKVELK